MLVCTLSSRWPLIAAVACCAMAVARAESASGDEWSTYGHDAGGMRYSPLKQINPRNVATLAPAWTYHMAKTPPGERPRLRSSQTTPLVVGGKMFISTPYAEAVALDATTGVEIWSYKGSGAGGSKRGVEYWPGDKRTAPRVFFGNREGKLIALNAADGTLAAPFGENGAVDLKTDAVMNGNPKFAYGMSSPPVVHKNLIITGSQTQESPALGASGDVRAWDVRDGKLVWTFHTVPRPGEIGHETWAGDRLMCQQPPWGTLTAINVHTAEIVWQSRLGVTDSFPREVANTGRPSSGGSIATASGLIFIGATDDNRFRAFAADSGRELWATKLPASAHATPITYLGKDGRQYVVVVATGGSLVESLIESDVVQAFVLPQ